MVLNKVSKVAMKLMQLNDIRLENGRRSSFWRIPSLSLPLILAYLHAVVPHLLIDRRRFSASLLRSGKSVHSFV